MESLCIFSKHELQKISFAKVLSYKAKEVRVDKKITKKAVYSKGRKVAMNCILLKSPI